MPNGTDQDEWKRFSDIDECIEQPGICAEVCVNEDFTYSCKCITPGYMVNAHNKSQCIGSYRLSSSSCICYSRSDLKHNRPTAKNTSLRLSRAQWKNAIELRETEFTVTAFLPHFSRWLHLAASSLVLTTCRGPRDTLTRCLSAWLRKSSDDGLYVKTLLTFLLQTLMNVRWISTIVQPLRTVPTLINLSNVLVSMDTVATV